MSARVSRTLVALVAGWLLPAAAPQVGAQTNWGLTLVGRDLVFTDLSRGQIIRRAPDGTIAVLLDDIHCHSLAADHDGTVYAEAVGTGRGGAGETVALWRIPANGSPELAMAPTQAPAPGMWIARDAAGTSYSWHNEADRRSVVLRRTADGEVSVLAGDTWGTADGRGAAARFGRVGAIAATGTGVLYLTDSTHLRRVAPNGLVTTVARQIVDGRKGGLPGDLGLFNRTVGMAVGHNETVYLADVYNLRVTRWDAGRGSAIVWDGNTWLARLTNGGLAWRPLGIAADRFDLYVLEALTVPAVLAPLVGTPRIVRVTADGRTRRVATIANRPLQVLVVLALTAVAFLSGWRRRSARQRRSEYPGVALRE